MAQSRHYTSTAQPTVLVASITPSSTVVQVQAVTGFPVSYPYVVALGYGTSSEELALVTSAVGTSLTVTRAYDGTSASSHSAGDPVRHTWAGADGNDSRAHEAATSGVHGVVGNLVGDTDTQTLSNKTLTAPLISSPTISGNIAGSPTFTGTPTFNLANFRNTVGSTVESVRVTGDANDRYQVTSDGIIRWGSGTGATDVTLSRTAADTLALASGDQLNLLNNNAATPASTNHAFQIGPTSGVNLRFDTNDIKAINNGVASSLGINSDGGNVSLFGTATAQFTVGGHAVINNGTAANNALQVNAAAGQSANIFNVRNSGGTSQVVIDSVGRLGISPDATSGNALNVSTVAGFNGLLMALKHNAADVFTVSEEGNVRYTAENPGLSVTPAAGWSQNAIVARRFGPILAWSVIMERTGANISIGANGNIVGDPDVFTTPATYNPLASQFVMFNTATYEGGAFLSSATNICSIRSGTPSATITTGDIIGFTFCYAIA